jgi:4-hydroxy-tetrahydrodipicolinate reductase
MVTRVAVVGASGRLGSLACTLIEQQSDLALVARLDSRSDLGEMLGADVVLDVTAPGVSPTVVDHAVRAGLKVLVGTSGWSEDRLRTLRTLLQSHPDAGVIVIPNFSIGSVLATHLSTIAARYFESIEIVETHHAAKVDSPSGTAVRTAELIGHARAELGPVVAPHTDQRARGQQVASVPIHSLRLQGAVARQDVHLGGTGEVLTITHETLSPSSYEAGILLGLRAALETTGLVVGLDALIGLSGSGPSPAAADAAAAAAAADPAGADAE